MRTINHFICSLEKPWILVVIPFCVALFLTALILVGAPSSPPSGHPEDQVDPVKIELASIDAVELPNGSGGVRLVVPIGGEVVFSVSGVKVGSPITWKSLPGASQLPPPSSGMWDFPGPVKDKESFVLKFPGPGVFAFEVVNNPPGKDPRTDQATIAVVPESMIVDNHYILPDLDVVPWYGDSPPPYKIVEVPPTDYPEGNGPYCDTNISVPDYLWVNDDDDNVDREWDKSRRPILFEDDLGAVNCRVATTVPGTMTLSIVEGGDKIGNGFWKDKSKLEPAATTWEVYPPGLSKRVWIEGVGHSARSKDVSFKVSFEESSDSVSKRSLSSSGGGSASPCRSSSGDATTVYNVDLDIDSLNDSGFEVGGYTQEEDESEPFKTANALGLPGKYVIASGGDADLDGVPHFADGFDLLGSEPLNVGGDASADDTIMTTARRFVPVRLRLDPPFNPQTALVKINYPDALPRLIGEGQENGIRIVEIGGGEFTRKGLELVGGGLRLWGKPAHISRNKESVAAGGDFVPGSNSGENWVSWSDLVRSATGSESYGENEVILYLEYIHQFPYHGSDEGTKLKISLDVTDGEVFCGDDITVTLVPADVDLDSDCNNRQMLPEASYIEEASEWVGPSEDETPGVAGKILQVSSGDIDQDGIPDFADGLKDKFRDTEYGLIPEVSELLEAAPMTPFILFFPEVDDLRSRAKIRFRYSHSDPADIAFNDKEDGTRTYLLPDTGEMRIWRKNSVSSNSEDIPKSIERSIRSVLDGGDFVPSDEEIPFNDLLVGEGQEKIDGGVVLYLEAVKASEKIGGLRVEIEMGIPDEEGEIHDWSQIDAFMLSAIDTALMSVNKDGLTEKADGLALSHPSPVINITGHNIVNRRMNPDHYVGGMVVDIELTGEVLSEVCDTLPGNTAGSKGVVDKVVVHHPSYDAPFATIPIGEQQKGHEPHSLNKPFPYLGKFTHTLIAVPLIGGNNVISFSARDNVYQIDGEAEMSFSVTTHIDFAEGDAPVYDDDPAAPPAGYDEKLKFELKFEQPLSDESADRLIGKAFKDDESSLLLELWETTPNSGYFTSTDGSCFVNLSSSPEDFDPNVTQFVTAHVVYSPFEIDHSLGLLETENDSNSFLGSFSRYHEGPDYPPVDVSDPIVHYASTGGIFEPYVFQVLGPPKLLEQIREVGHHHGSEDPAQGEASSTLDFSAAVKKIEQEEAAAAALARAEAAAQAAEHEELLEARRTELENLRYRVRQIQAAPTMWLLKCAIGDSAAVVSFSMGLDGDNSGMSEEEYLRECKKISKAHRPRSLLQFSHGFAKGLMKGGAEMVGGLKEAAKFAGRVVVEGVVKVGAAVVKAGTWLVELTTGQDCSQARRAVTDFEKKHTPIFEMAKKLASYGGDLALALLTGDFEKLEKLSGPLRKVVMMAAEVFQELVKEWATDDSYDRGFKAGRAFFEIVSFFLPLAKAGKLVNLSKGKFLDELENVKLFQRGDEAKALARTKEFNAAIKITKQCFVAGTLVLTQAGAKPIEEIEIGDSVLARDEFTMEQAFKPVLQTFVTHPTELVEVKIKFERGEDYEVETILGTPPHPFWVEGREEFVPMGDLKIGDRLSLSDKKVESWVISIRPIRGPPDEVVTTYNFEVEDFHTYFVGESGVWVHNHGAPCEKIFSVFFQKAKDLGGTSNLKAERFNVLMETKVALTADKAIPDASWAQSAREVSATMLDDVAAGKIDVDDLPTFNDWDRGFFKASRANSGRKVAKVDIENHHVIPRKVSELLKDKGALPSNFNPNSVPGHAYTKEIHRGLHEGADGMNAMLKSADFQSLPADEMAEAVVDYYRDNGFESMAAVAEVWFSNKGVF